MSEADLPEGFTLDHEPHETQDLPKGFTLDPNPHADTFWGNIARGYWPTTDQAVNLVKDAGRRMKTGIKETAASIPVLGAAVPRDAAMERYEKENPGITAINKVGGGIAGTLPLMAAAPAAFGADASMPWLARTGAGAASNAGISAADTKLRGGSEEDAINNAIVSGLIGGAIPAGGAAMRGAKDAASSMPYAGTIVKNILDPKSAPLPRWLGGDWGEGLLAYLTGGKSEIPLGAIRFGKGVYSGVKEGQQQGWQTTPTVTVASPEQLMRGALARQAIANALTQQNQPSQ